MIRFLLTCLFVASGAVALEGGDARKSAKFQKPGKIARMSDMPRNCGPRDRVTSFLEDKYGERIAKRRLTDAGTVAEDWEAPGTWSVVVTSPDGVSCIVLSGKTARQRDG